MTYYAHSTQTSSKADWEPLFTPFGEVNTNGAQLACGSKNGGACNHCESMHPMHGHLNKVAYWTAKFAANMFCDQGDKQTASQWGYVTGLWHDLGKFSKEFQSYLEKASDPHNSEILLKVDHTTAGAKLAAQKGISGHLIANAIAGHHAGLLDSRGQTEEGASIVNRLQKGHGHDLAAIDPPTSITEIPLPPVPSYLTKDKYSLSFFQRMIFSCLVDADFLCTESFMNAEQAKMRPDSSDKFKDALDLLTQKISSFPKATDAVSKARQSVYEDCLQASEKDPDFFSLTVPTGGGKTLSSMAFALKHAIKHQKKRIIYVIPFTSIIEQNAQVLKEIFEPLGANFVLEHHSNITPDEGKETTKNRLAAENWDAPIIFTTAVQFYESCFAHRTSRTRKLHNIANSVVIFDEAQTIPTEYLKPCLELLKNLTNDFHVTSVLCTATQPAINKTEYLEFGLEKVTEIIGDIPTLFSSLERTRLTNRGQLSDDALVKELHNTHQALVIVNTKKHSQTIAEALGDDSNIFHLSTSMCPQHRKEVLKEVKDRLIRDEPTLLISTQLIEAGVDIDFPLVYRSMAGLDSISQAAGRCNRNGKLPISTVHIFESEHDNEMYFNGVKNVGKEMLDLYADAPLEPVAIENYFQKYYQENKNNWDKHEILDCFTLNQNKDLPFLFNYKTASQNFKLIKEETFPVLIPYNEEARELLKQLRTPNINLHRKLFRQLQVYSVQIRSKPFFEFQSEFESLRDGEFYALTNTSKDYSPKYGLNIKALTISDCII